MIKSLKITDIKTYILHCDLEHPFQSSHSQFNARRHCLVSIHCDDGTVGWGECLGPADITSTSVHMMKPLLLGESPLNIDPLWLKLYNQFRDSGQAGGIIQAISGIDIALWDIMGKVYNAPIYQLLGGGVSHQSSRLCHRGISGHNRATHCNPIPRNTRVL